MNLHHFHPLPPIRPLPQEAQLSFSLNLILPLLWKQQLQREPMSSSSSYALFSQLLFFSGVDLPIQIRTRLGGRRSRVAAAAQVTII